MIVYRVERIGFGSVGVLWLDHGREGEKDVGSRGYTRTWGIPILRLSLLLGNGVTSMKSCLECSPPPQQNVSMPYMGTNNEMGAQMLEVSH